MKKSNYWKWHYANAPLTREELNAATLKIVQYHTNWDETLEKYVRHWSIDDVSMKSYIKKSPRLYTRKPQKGTNYPTVQDFLAKYIIKESDETTKRKAWAHFQSCLEIYNQDKIDSFKLWEALEKYKSVDKHQQLDNINDSAIRLAELGYKSVTPTKREYYKELWLDRAADYGVYPQSISWLTKDVSTFSVAPIAEPAWNPEVDPIEDYWVRPWKTYHDSEDTDPSVTVATKYTVTETPSYKEDEAFAIAKGLCKLGGDEFLEKTSVLATPENNDYERRMQLAMAYVKAHKDELPPMELVAKAMQLYDIPATQIVTKTDRSTGKAYTELVTGETNGYTTRRDTRLGNVEDEDPLVLRDFQVEIDTVDSDEFDEAAYLGYTDEVLSEEEEYDEDEDDEDQF